MMKRLKIILASFLIVSLFVGCSRDGGSSSAEETLPRTIITTDGEVDDIDSFIRLLLYANEMNIEGIVYSSSQWHYSGDGKGTLFISPTQPRYGERTDLRWAGTDWVKELIDDYAVVYPNLVQHDSNYPAPEYLQSIVKVGNIEFEGEMEKDTEGSDFIKEILLDDEPGPVYVQIWGGTNTLARALKSIQERYQGTAEWDNIYGKVSEKTVIYTVLDQDITYKQYVEPNWPEIRVIYNASQFWSFAYSWTRVVPDTLKHFLSGPWFAENILFNHGTLLERYFTWGDGKKIEGDPEHTQGDPENAARRNMPRYSFISEGDSPAYFFLLNYGLRSKEDPSYGGLGGRFAQSETNPRRWEDGNAVTDFNPYSQREETSYPQVRWIEVLQNDFAARADWCVNGYAGANHRPVVKVDGPLDIEAAPGKQVKLRATATDPDGDAVNYSWWQYEEAGTYRGAVVLDGADERSATVTVPDDAERGETIHIILEVKDDGVPALTSFQRVIVTVI
jgi:hypothetical protein